jgi:sporulation protein YlmC with PRC-barrel domain
MNASTDVVIGTGVTCTDGTCGRVTRVVIDPVAQALTHLVVGPKPGTGKGHLVPVSLAEAGNGEVRLRCTIHEFEALPQAEITEFLDGAKGQWGYAQEDMLSWPYYGLGAGAYGLGGMGMGISGAPAPAVLTYDRIPQGDSEIHRGDHVHAADGEIGKVQGLVIDPRDHHITHVLLDEGHLWAKKRVAIPSGSIERRDGAIHALLTKDQIGHLPPIAAMVTADIKPPVVGALPDA